MPTIIHGFPRHKMTQYFQESLSFYSEKVTGVTLQTVPSYQKAFIGEPASKADVMGFSFNETLCCTCIYHCCESWANRNHYLRRRRSPSFADSAESASIQVLSWVQMQWGAQSSSCSQWAGQVPSCSSSSS